MKNLKKVMALFLAVLFVCLTGFTAKNGDNLDKVLASGKLVIGMEGNWAPWTYHDDDDILTGFDVEVGRYIAEKLGVEAEFVEGEWDGLLAGVKAGRYDMVINGVDITDERSEAFHFSAPYAFIKTALVVRADDDSIQSLEDLKGKKTANSIGSTYMEIAESYGATVSGVDTLDETIQVLLQGRMDATLNADQSILDYLSQHPDAPIKIVCYAGDANGIAIPMVKGEKGDSLAAAVDEIIAEMHETGVLTELAMKYFGEDITTK